MRGCAAAAAAAAADTATIGLGFINYDSKLGFRKAVLKLQQQKYVRAETVDEWWRIDDNSGW